MTRPLLIIFLTIFVNLVGFGIIIPLLPFYAETFGASPLVIGLLFAVFSLCQLDRGAARSAISRTATAAGPVLIFSLAGTVVSFVMLALAHIDLRCSLSARIVDGLSGGNISTARAYVADITEPQDRARAYGLIGAAFGLGFIFGPALSGVLVRHQLYGADLGGGRDHARRHGDGLAVAARDGAPGPGRHRQSAPLPAGAAPAPAAPPDPRDRLRLLVRVRDLSDHVRRCSPRARFGFGAGRRPAICSRLRPARRGRSRAASSGRSSGGSGTSRRSWSGLVFSAIGLLGVGVRATRSPLFVLTLVPAGARHGLRPCRRFRAWSAARRGGDEQGRVQGAASAVESLRRTIGPVWGNASLQRFRRRDALHLRRRRCCC